MEKCGSFVVPSGPEIVSDCGCSEIAALEPLPTLDFYSRWVLSIFNHVLPLMSSAMVGALHVDRQELYREMQARGFDLTDFFLEKFAICEAAYRDAYAKHKDSPAQ